VKALAGPPVARREVMASDRTAVVECVSLTKTFRDFWGRDKVLAVDRLDLRIEPGEVFGLLGPNGSGKSTTLKILLGLLYPTSGRARLFDRAPTDTSIKSRIGFMPEESYLYRFLNARETLDFYGRLFNLDRRERKRRTEQLIDMIGLRKAARRQVGQYSKGMARRIGLAQALINDPDLLILDEPTTGLDPIGSRQIKDVIVELQKRGKTVLLSSHLLADVEDVCDRVTILYGGRVQAAGSVRELLARRDVTQIDTERIEEGAIDRVRQAVERESGRRVLSVQHPTDRLEEFFLRVVTAAQRDRLVTSGAESGRGVTEFLSARPDEASPQRVLDALVRPVESIPAATPAAPAAPAKASEPDRSRLDTLTTSTPRPAPLPASQPPAAKPESPAGPRPLPSKNKADASVLERLTRDDDAPPP